MKEKFAARTIVILLDRTIDEYKRTTRRDLIHMSVWFGNSEVVAEQTKPNFD